MDNAHMRFSYSEPACYRQRNYLVLPCTCSTAIQYITVSAADEGSQFSHHVYLKHFSLLYAKSSYYILYPKCFETNYFIQGRNFIPFDYIVLAAIQYGVSTTMAFNLIPILNGTR
jgi:hypothetical protein